ncbi:MAG: hypothetical protein V2I35_08315, partial [Desulfocapsaceae bacterium]|nr:hypothetical protein [Desulfocapsaceae bacterium]
AWGWFQFLLLLTFPLHLLAMNAMLGGLGIGITQQVLGGDIRSRLAHRIAIALPLVIAVVVNLGVAPLLFLQVLYGQFAYTSAILMGAFWIMIVPLLIIAYYGAYLYDFNYYRLGSMGILVAVLTFCLLIVIAYFFSNNMLLMTLPERFAEYFSHMAGDYLVSGDPQFLPRYLHMIFGALAVGGLFVAILGRFRATADPELAEHALRLGMKVFSWFTCLNVCFGLWYLLVIDRETMMMFMGADLPATISFTLALVLVVMVIVSGFRNKLLATFAMTTALVYLMTFMRAWVRSSYLREHFTLGDLQVVTQYSPLVFFLVTLVLGIACVIWMLRLTAAALKNDSRPSV